MFRFQIDDNSEIRILEERHAEVLFELIEQNRERHLEIPQFFRLKKRGSSSGAIFRFLQTTKVWE